MSVCANLVVNTYGVRFVLTFIFLYCFTDLGPCWRRDPSDLGRYAAVLNVGISILRFSTAKHVKFGPVSQLMTLTWVCKLIT